MISKPEALENLNIGHAVDMLKRGYKVARKGWNGKGMFLYYIPENRYTAITPIAKSFMGEDEKVPYAAYVAMKTADNKVVPWVCSQTDLLAEDWVVLDAVAISLNDDSTFTLYNLHNDVYNIICKDYEDLDEVLKSIKENDTPYDKIYLVSFEDKLEPNIFMLDSKLNLIDTGIPFEFDSF